MNIGEVAKATGLNAKLIRHYESIGLLPKASRSASGYRLYAKNDVDLLSFVRRARSLGFSMEEIKKLVALLKNKSRASKDVKALTESHLARLDAKIKELVTMRETLQHLTRECHGDHRSHCSILEGLASPSLVARISAGEPT